jgi:hypothetical protein
MGGHRQYDAARRRPARDQKRQQALAFPPVRQMQPRTKRKRRPAIACHQQCQPSLPGQPRDGPKQPCRQPARHHPGTAWQMLHGQARVRQPHRVAE